MEWEFNGENRLEDEVQPLPDLGKVVEEVSEKVDVEDVLLKIQADYQTHQHSSPDTSISTEDSVRDIVKRQQEQNRIVEQEMAELDDDSIEEIVPVPRLRRDNLAIVETTKPIETKLNS
jgi:hypothetical protein